VFLYPITGTDMFYIAKYLKNYDYLLKLHNKYPDYPAIKLVLWEKQELIG
jgi:hypothetical protein